MLIMVSVASNSMTVKNISNITNDRESIYISNCGSHSHILRDHDENVNNTNQGHAKMKSETKFNDYQINKQAQFIPKTPENNLKRSKLESSVKKTTTETPNCRIQKFGLVENQTPVRDLDGECKYLGKSLVEAYCGY